MMQIFAPRCANYWAISVPKMLASMVMPMGLWLSRTEAEQVLLRNPHYPAGGPKDPVDLDGSHGLPDHAARTGIKHRRVAAIDFDSRGNERLAASHPILTKR